MLGPRGTIRRYKIQVFRCDARFRVGVANSRRRRIALGWSANKILSASSIDRATSVFYWACRCNCANGSLLSMASRSVQRRAKGSLEDIRTHSVCRGIQHRVVCWRLEMGNPISGHSTSPLRLHCEHRMDCVSGIRVCEQPEARLVIQPQLVLALDSVCLAGMVRVPLSRRTTVKTHMSGNATYQELVNVLRSVAEIRAGPAHRNVTVRSS
jgi:hypothetical protein